MKKQLIISILLVWIISCKKEAKLEVVTPETPAAVKDLEIAIIDIKTNNQQAISTKTTYVDGNLTIRGLSKYKTFSEKIKIKGRGNFSWELPKKAYHFEFDKSVNLFDFGLDKDYNLLANYLDFNHITNAAGFTIAKLLEMPYTSSFQPVELYLNDNFQGLYLLTHQVEKENTRVNIDDLGTLVELDSYYNDQYKFKTPNYALPINVKYPKTMDEARFAKIKADFNALDASIASAQFPNSNFADLLDIDAFCDYLIVTYLTDNREINHPKSTFMYKNSKGKIAKGPVWDFDWGFGFQYNESYFNNPTANLFSGSSSSGNKFFTKIMTSPVVRAKFKEKWNNFKTTKFDKLLSFVDTYSKTIQNARQSDLNRWNLKNRDFPTEMNNMKTWLTKKSEKIDSMVMAW